MRKFLLIISIVISATCAFGQESRTEVGRTVPQKDSIREALKTATRKDRKGSIFNFNAKAAEGTISVTGEPDILRHTSSLPGVSFGIEGTMGLFVRGGNNGSNGVVFNDVPMFASTHLFGLFSVIPSNIATQATFYSGGIPASRGNLSSSLLEIGAKHAQEEKIGVKASISPYLIGAYAHFPVIKDKLTVRVSGRSSYIPYIVDKFNDSDERYRIDVYDIYATADYKPSGKHSLDMMLVNTKDYFNDKEYWPSSHHTEDRDYQRFIAAKLGWKYKAANNFDIRLVAYSLGSTSRKSRYYGSEDSKYPSIIELSSKIRESTLKASLGYNPMDQISVKGGIDYQRQAFTPGNKKYIISEERYSHGTHMTSRLLSVYAEPTFKPFGWLEVTPGARFTHQKSDTSAFDKVDLHVLSHVYFSNSLGLELAYDRQHQFYHVLEGLPTGWSLSIATACSEDYPAEETSQYYSGIFWNRLLGSMDINFSVGGYYREMRNMLSFINPANSFSVETTSWQSDVDLGEGTSYGMETSANIQGKKLHVTAAYTLSKTDRTFPNINSGRTYPFKFDRRHVLNFQTQYDFAEKIKSRGRKAKHSASLAVSYASGNRMTLPLANYKGVAPPYWTTNGGREWGWTYDFDLTDRHRILMSEKNGFKARDFFRIDVGYSFSIIGKKYTNTFSASVYNVLNRRNPYNFFFEDDEWKQISVFPIMPSVRWTISW